MNGEKVLYLEDLCVREGLGFLCFDYSGHGQSSGEFEEGSISRWLQDSLEILDSLTQGSVILIGSSMGGWIAHLVALRRPHRVTGLVGIACAPDFTQELMWKSFSSQQQDEVTTQGWTILSTQDNDQGWRITKILIEDGKNHLLLGNPIPLHMPIRYLHGLQDTVVPASFSRQLLELVASPDITLTLIKSGDHRLSREEDKRLLGNTLRELIGTSPLTKEA
jgi:pimeloyl-ACP methyl ester carboxylesterase